MSVTPVGQQSRPSYKSQSALRASSLTLALVATFVVTVLPVGTAWLLRRDHVITSPLLGVAIAVAISLGLAWLGQQAWSRRLEGDDAVFSELLIWGWLRRLRAERRLAHAEELLEELGATRSASPRRRAQLLSRMTDALEAQDLYLEGHSRRVARHATMIARQMKLGHDEILKIRAAAAIHDVGKLNVPKEVLNKPGRLTQAEFDLIKRHPVDGEAIVSGLGDPAINSIVRHHHERLDGLGYPDGWTGAEIPLGARIVAVADTFDAVTSTRAYRSAASHRDALQVLREASGTQLDPDAVQAFLRYYAGRRSITMCATLVSWLGLQWRRANAAVGTGSAESARFALLAGVSAAVAMSGVAIVRGPIGQGAVPAARAATLAAGLAAPAAALSLGSSRDGLAAGAITGIPAVSTRPRTPALAGQRTRSHVVARHRAVAGRRHAGSGSSSRGGVISASSPLQAAPRTQTPPSTGTKSPPSAGGSSGTSGGGSRPAPAPQPVATSPTSSSGNSGAQGLVHGRGPNGNGPPGLTGQNPGQSGAPPPGQAKKG